MATNKIVDKAYLERQFRNYHKTVVKPQIQEIESDLTTKVDKIAGYGLSKNDLTDALKNKLDNLENYDDTELVAAAEQNESDLETLNGDVSDSGSVDKIVNDRIVELVGGQNVSKDTLGKVSTWISGHVTSASDMEDAIEANTDDIEALQAQQAAAAYEMETEDLSFTSLLAPITISGDSSVITGQSLTLTSDISGVTWSSSDNTKATVNNGVVTALAAGEVTITASKIGFTAATKTITVLDRIEITASQTANGEAVVESGESIRLTPSVGGSRLSGVTWTSSDIHTADVRSFVDVGDSESFVGEVTGQEKVGEVTITASKPGYAPNTIVVTVYEKGALPELDQ